MARTVTDLMSQSLRLIGAMSSANAMTVAEALTNLQSINLMLASWNLDPRILATFTEFSAVTDEVSFDAGVDLAVIYNWAIYICPEYNRSASAEVVRIAAESLDAVKTANTKRPASASFDFFGGGSIEIERL